MNRKIRILHVVQSAGGVDRYLRTFIKYLDNQLFENIVVCSYDFRSEDYKELVSCFEQVDMRRTIGMKDFFLIGKVRKLIKKYKPDIVYAHSSKAGVIGRIANIGLKSKCVYNPHGWSFNMRCSSINKRMYVLIERVVAKFCDKIICISDAEKKSALDNKICKEYKLKVIYNGIDIEVYENGEHNVISRRDLNIPKEAFVVGMVGRISQQKAPDVFVEAAEMIKRKLDSSFFIIVGDGEQKDYIINYATENGLVDSLYVTGWVDNPMDYIELFDVATLLSRWEGFGLVLPEYMIERKPIVATNVDAIPNIICDGKNGLLVRMDQPSEVCEAVMRLHDDKELYQSIVDNAHEDVYCKYDAKRVAEEHKELFFDMCY